MQWVQLNSEHLLDTIISNKGSYSLIFKHSTRCSISSMALNRLERSWDLQEMRHTITPYYLDLLNYRNISNKVSEMFEIVHQSPQLLLIKDGKCIYHASHMGISYQKLKENLYITE